MSRKPLAIAAVILSACICAVPAGATTIEHIIEQKTLTVQANPATESAQFYSILRNSIEEDRENYCISYSAADNDTDFSKGILIVRDRIDGSCNDDSRREIEFDINYTGVNEERQAEIAEQISEQGINDGDEITIEDEDYIHYRDENVNLYESDDGETYEYSNLSPIEYATDIEALNGNVEADIEPIAYDGTFGPFDAGVDYLLIPTEGEAIYDPIKVSVILNPVIYIPQETEDTQEAYIAAASEKIRSVLGDDANFSVEYGGKISENESYAEFIDDCNSDEYYSQYCALRFQDYDTDDYYIFILDNKSDEILIVKVQDEGGKGGDEELAEETETSVVVATASSDNEIVENEGEPETITASAIVATNNNVNYSNAPAATSTPSKVETEETKESTEEKKEDEQEESEESTSSPLPIIIVGIVAVTGIALFATRKKNGKKYSH